MQADELWHFYAGSPLELFDYAPASRELKRQVLGEVHVAVIPAGVWQAARPLGDYTLVGCTVGPGFEFADFQFVSDLPTHDTHFTGPMSQLRTLL